MNRSSLLIYSVFMAFSASPAAADPAADLMAAYQVWAESNDPAEKANTTGHPARSWPKATPEALEHRALAARALLARLASVDTMDETDRAILRRLLVADINHATLDTARQPFTGDWGFHAEPLFAAINTRIETPEDADAWIARLEDLPRYFDEHIANMRRGLETGWVSHADPLGTVVEQVTVQAGAAPEASDLYAPLKSLPASFDPVSRVRVETRGKVAIAKAILAYQGLLAFLETEYRPRAREGAGIANLAGGRAAYQRFVDEHTAGAGYTPEEIHALGQAEVKRIRAEMEAIIKETGFKGDFKAFQTFLRTDPQFYVTSEGGMMKMAKATARALDEILPRYFSKLPNLPYTVEPVPAAIAPGYTSGRYSEGDAKQGRPGKYLVNTYALNERPLYELPALSAHEAVPGHHLQIALAQEVEGAPRFRQTYYATAFGEGWGLYAERLAGEAGIYNTPYERFGALSMEMWRACRLVADTGLHWYGWTRAEAEACFNENTALAPLNIKNEVTRYMGWPGQAVAYKIGEIKIRALREEAQAALGGGFDIREFHGVILNDGALPMDLLEKKVHAWIERKKEGVPK